MVSSLSQRNSLLVNAGVCDGSVQARVQNEEGREFTLVCSPMSSIPRNCPIVECVATTKREKECNVPSVAAFACVPFSFVAGAVFVLPTD